MVTQNGTNCSGKKRKRIVGYISLGCPKNLVDTEFLLGALREKGFAISDEIEGSEIAIVNTCGFIKEAKEESIDVILKCARLKEEGRLKYLVVAGCLPQRYKDELVKELKEADAFIGVPRAAMVRGKQKCLYDHKSPRYILTPRHYAYVKIADGCINRCSYCAVPLIRGTYRSREMKSIVKEAEGLIGMGAKEINLIAQDTTLYGTDACGKPRLAELLENLSRARGSFWIRLLYAHPAHVTDELIEALRDNPKICKYVDLPIQHVNDDILSRMRRKITRKKIARLIEKLRSEIPDLTIRTSLIVGFPGETKAQFEELLDFVRESRFERLGAFAYSREEGTPAARFPGQVTESVKRERLDELMALQQDISREVNAKYSGRTVKVLIDEQSGDSYIARSYADAPEVDGCVYVKSRRRLKPGDFADVRVIDTLEYDLVGVEV